jgi:drug/metabolite transporter (DMT)-like permease
MGYVTNVSFLQAFRQISLPVGFLAGVMILHEKPYRTKVVGVAVIVAGLLVMIFG